MVKLRCCNCKKVLLEADLKEGSIKKICDNCGTVNTITAGRESYQDRLHLVKKDQRPNTESIK